MLSNALLMHYYTVKVLKLKDIKLYIIIDLQLVLKVSWETLINKCLFTSPPFIIGVQLGVLLVQLVHGDEDDPCTQAFQVHISEFKGTFSVTLRWQCPIYNFTLET